MVILWVNIRVRPPPSWNSVFGTTWLRFSSRSRFRARVRNLVGPGPGGCWFHLGSAYLHIMLPLFDGQRGVSDPASTCVRPCYGTAMPNVIDSVLLPTIDNWTIEFRTVRGTVSTEHAELTCLGDHFLADHLTWTRSHCAEINSKWDIRRAPILLEVYLYFWCCISAPWCSKFNTFVAFPKCRQNCVEVVVVSDLQRRFFFLSELSVRTYRSLARTRLFNGIMDNSGLGSTPELELELGSTPTPTLELELELKPPELELELIFKRLVGVGVGVGVETPGVGLELELKFSGVGVGIGVVILSSYFFIIH